MLSRRTRSAATHLGLFVACCATTWWGNGPAFAATLMGILLCHELGHYLVGRYHGVDVSLPYFIPVPPQITLGTLGAVIRMRKPIADRNALFDVGAAGPVAGLVVAIPLLVIGLTLSDLAPIKPDEALEGNSILYALLKYAMFGRWLPSDGIDVQLHPMAFAGWVGLLITMINLMPIGQLDGGHILYAFVGQRAKLTSRVLAVCLVGLGWNRNPDGTLSYTYSWLVWATALFITACGTGHVMDIWVLLYPHYDAHVGIKLFTALASAVAAGLAQGLDLAAAVARGRDYVAEAIRSAPGFGKGHGPLNHAWPLERGERHG